MLAVALIPFMEYDVLCQFSQITCYLASLRRMVARLLLILLRVVEIVLFVEGSVLLSVSHPLLVCVCVCVCVCEEDIRRRCY